MPWPSIGSNRKKFITSLRAWHSIQSIDGSIASCAQMIAEILRSLVKADDRIIAAERQKHDARAMPAERGIELQARAPGFRSPGTIPSCGRQATISSASLSRATLQRCAAKRSMRSSHSRPLRGARSPRSRSCRTADRAGRCAARCISARSRAPRRTRRRARQCRAARACRAHRGLSRTRRRMPRRTRPRTAA